MKGAAGEHYNRKKGIFFITLAAFAFATMSLFVRLAGDLPTMEKAFFRNFPAVIISIFVLVRKKQSIRCPKNEWGSLFLRCFFGCAGLLSNFFAIDHIGLSDANLLNKMSPFFSMLLSFLILKEKPSRRNWLILIFAFSGAMFVVKPTAGSASVYHLVGLFGGFAAGVAYTFVRKLGEQGCPGPVIVFYFSAFSCLVTLPSLIQGFQAMTPEAFCMLMLAGVFGAMGQFFITAAYQAAPAKEISVFDYTQVVFSALLGFFILQEVPDGWSLFGYAVIIGAAFLQWRGGKNNPDPS